MAKWFAGKTHVIDFCHWYELASQTWDIKGKTALLELLWSAIESDTTNIAITTLKATQELIDLMKEMNPEDKSRVNWANLIVLEARMLALLDALNNFSKQEAS